MALEHLLPTYGYAALFVGNFLEGEAVLIAAAFAAHQGYLHLPWVIVTAFLASITGDNLYFWLGRSKGRVMLERRPHWQARVRRIGTLLDRYGSPVIVGFRFMYGMRSLTPFVIGLTDIPRRRFILLDLLGSSLWSLTIGIIGFLFGSLLQAISSDVKKYEHWIAAAILATGAVIWLVHRARANSTRTGLRRNRRS